MPTYEYRCAGDHEFEKFQSITAKPVARCPHCGRRARRQISGGAGLIFKGSGFYITDYKKSGGNGGTPAAAAKSGEGAKTPATDAAGAGKKNASGD